ncbi:MAG: tripartite tricarboxylate transporter substrate binding protein [Betaproteobacteria bacterium]|nr:tripartite tricarboxylate transporter substrate binding protein [Betaproteobacteria bacterium]MBI3057603.1 tripartite tricarboxylate transporter substrate binding protein [Betaproteobacteria bacterium]
MNIFLRVVMPGCIALAAAGQVLAADAYPSKPIRIIVAYTPAGTTDILARIIGQKMTESWGQPVIVENRPGAAGNIGTELAAKSTPDGYTLLMGTSGTHGINVNLYRNLSWHSLRSFAPISLVAMVPNIMVVNNAVPVKNVKELIAYAKANRGKINYGSPGYGSTAHLSMELFKSMTGTDLVHIPYKGSAGVLADVMGGQISVTIDNMPVYLPQVQAGKIRALAVSPAKRSPAAPDLPTIAESGVPGYDSGAWFGLLAPAGTQKAIVDKLAIETSRILKLPDVSRRISELGADPVGGTPQQFTALIKSEIAKWAKVIKEANVELQ